MTLVVRGVASVGGLGFLPRAPATVASVIAGAAWLLLDPNATVQVALICGVILLGQLCGERLSTLNARDPQYVVIDEVAGVWVALAGLESDFATCAAGVLAFRLLDRFKPWPIGVIDRRGGRFALVGDDLLAGLIANALLRTVGAMHG